MWSNQMAPTLSIETIGLTRRFGSRLAVDSLDLQVPAGCVCGFLGPNGAGKTTTIRLLLGLLTPTAGTILLDGQVLTREHPELRRWTGSLVESPSLYPHLTGRENLEVFRRLLGLTVTQIDEALALVQLASDANRRVRTYSLGMRQRLGLALALLGNPKLLVLDEPANGLDPAGVRDLRDLLRRLVEERGATIFLSSHLLSEVEQIADRVAILNQGRLLFQGRLADFQAERGLSLMISVDRAAHAQRVLKDHGWSVRELPTGDLSVTISDPSDAATINALLVKEGVAIYRFSQERPTLESLFLSATDDLNEGVPG
jgi:lantibiotic transport system ATP-binding protein